VTAPLNVGYMLVKLNPDGTASLVLPCDCVSELVLTPEQVNMGMGIHTSCAGCDGLWTLVPMPPHILKFIGSTSADELPEDHVALLIVDGLMQ